MMKKFTNLISLAIKDIISDIYITGGQGTVSRKSGNIRFHGDIKWSYQEVDDLVRYLLNARQLDSLRERKSLDHAISISNARLRINIFNTTSGLSVVIRILPGHIPTIDALNLHPSLNEIPKLKSGLVLNCGPTGMGKTTTIAAIINEINNTRAAHIITLENPIEYRFKNNKSFIQQRELDTHMPSFAQGLLDVLRENPDVIVVGELREPETMKLTLNAAESGHLVIATLHASTPEEAIYRLCNSVNVESQSEIRYQLASTLNWLIVQRLIFLESAGNLVPLLNIVRGTPAIKNIIRENKAYQIESAIQLGKNDGMYNSDRYLNEYLPSRQKFTSPLQIFRSSSNQAEDIDYKSPLMEEQPRLVEGKKHLSVTSVAPIVINTDFSSSTFEHIVNIEEDESLSELVNKMQSDQESVP
jgi:twitching motility protein PilT